MDLPISSSLVANNSRCLGEKQIEMARGICVTYVTVRKQCNVSVIFCSGERVQLTIQAKLRRQGPNL